MNLPLTKYELDRATGVDLATVGLALGGNAAFGAVGSPFSFNPTIFREFPGKVASSASSS